jgi:hypothetical protein
VSVVEAVVLRVGRKEVFELHGTAFELWQIVASPIGLDEVVDTLARAHGVDPAHIADDVLAAVERLETAGVVESIE